MQLLEDREVITQIDVATAFLQSTPFGPDEAPRYLVVKDPVTQQLRYFRQHGVVYRSSSASKHWEDTLYLWIRELDSTEVNEVRVPGFVQGKNDAVSSAASEIYAASVALSEFLHPSYVSDEMGWTIGLPLEI